MSHPSNGLTNMVLILGAKSSLNMNMVFKRLVAI